MFDIPLQQRRHMDDNYYDDKIIDVDELFLEEEFLELNIDSDDFFSIKTEEGDNIE